MHCTFDYNYTGHRYQTIDYNYTGHRYQTIDYNYTGHWFRDAVIPRYQTETFGLLEKGSLCCIWIYISFTQR